MDTVCITLRKTDLIAFALHELPRRRDNRLYATALFLGILIYILVRSEADSLYAIAVACIAAAAGAVAATLVSFACNMACFVIPRRPNSGVFGAHGFSLHANGIREWTDVNDSLHKWKAVDYIKKTPKYLGIGVAGTMLFVLPRRDFPSDEAYTAFFDQAHAMWQQYASPVATTRTTA